MTFEELRAEYEALKMEHSAVVAQFTSDNLHLKLRISKLEAMLFGRSSERRAAEAAASGQPYLFKVDQAKAPTKEEEEKEEISSYARRKRSILTVLEEEKEEGTFPAHLMRVEGPPIDDIPAGVEKADCVFVGTKVTERLAEEPSYNYVIRTVRNVYKHKQSGQFYAPLAPRHVFGRCQVDESFLVAMVVKKILWHLPLYRQHQALKLQGIELPRSNFAMWMGKLGVLFSSIAKAVESGVKGDGVVHCDETPILVAQYGDDGKKHYGSAYLWPILSEESGVAFIYRAGRTADDAKAVLSGINGTLVSDAYKAYEKLTQGSGQPWQLCMMHYPE